MGRCAEVLLVGAGRLAVLAFALGLALGAPAGAGTVRAQDYDAFWLWAGVKPQPELATARTLYILQGQVAAPDADEDGRLIAQGGAIPHLGHGEVWLDYRAHTLRWSPAVYDQILARLRRWRAAGNPVVGLQIDFDARTRRLDQYATFLADLRRRLPADCRLSITGLLDWSSQGDSAALDALGGVVDEVVLQTYQGRHTIPNYQAYLASLSRVTLPFKIGLAEGGDWTAPADLAANPWFRGYVVFLSNPAAEDAATR
ncbi:MAG TPA: DUF3142 domain-containing protein [Caulobacteraceae bacterium]|jgi:hypothetical protein|nr:DUF3142 domain-containing protein [Caulobacteraceae bacterium]